MAEPLVAELELDTTAALAKVDDLAAALERALADAVQAGLEALGTVTPEVDVAPVEEALAGVDTGLTAMIEAEGVDEVQAEIDGIDAEPVTVQVEAEGVDEVQAEIDGITAPEPIVVEVETEDARAGLDRVRDSAEGAGVGLAGVGAATGLAQGRFAGLAGVLGGLSPGFAGLVAGASAATGAFTVLARAGQESVAAQERLEVVLGRNARALDRIDVGGITGSLRDLAVAAAQTDEGFRQAAASVATLALSSGATEKQAVELAQRLIALTLRAQALNPALGDAGTVMQQLSLALARGGRFAARFGIDVTTAEITARALADTGKTAAQDLSVLERQAAGAALAVEKLGDSLGRDFARGIETQTVRINATGAQINEALQAAGEALVPLVVRLGDATALAAAAVADILGAVLKVVSPPVVAGLEVVAEAVGAVSQVLRVLPGEVLAAAAAFAAFRAVGGLATVTNAVSALGAAMGTLPGRATVGLAAVGALRIGLDSLGASSLTAATSMTQLGASVGFAVGGVKGLAVGLAVGAVVDLGRAMIGTSDATEKTREAVEGLDEQLAGLRVEGAVRSLDEAAGAFARLDEQLGRTLGARQLAAAFEEIGVSSREVAAAVRDLDVGRVLEPFGRIDARVQATVGALANLPPAVRRALVPPDARGLLDAFDRAAERARETGRGIDQLRVAASVPVRLRVDVAALADLGREARLGALALAGLSDAQVRAVEAAVRAEREFRRQARAIFEQTVAAEQVPPALAEMAVEQTRAASGAADHRAALGFLRDAMVGVRVDLDRDVRLLAEQARMFGVLGRAAEDAAGRIPTLGDALRSALDEVRFAETLDVSGLIGGVEQASQDLAGFFADVSAIANAGAQNVAAALLTLGPGDLGARVAADLAANEPQFREGLEAALRGFAAAQVAGEQILNEIRARVALFASGVSEDVRQRLRLEFDVAPTEASAGQIIAVLETLPDKGGEQGRAFIEAFNASVVAQELAGIDVGPLLGSLDAARVELAVQAAQAMDAVGVAITTGVPVAQATSAGRQTGDALSVGLVESVPGVQSSAFATTLAAGVGLVDASGVTLLQARTVGSQIGQGVAEGIRSQVSEVARAAERLVSEAISAARQRAEARSPSRLFALLGADMARGVASGLRAESEAVQDAARALVRLPGAEMTAQVTARVVPIMEDVPDLVLSRVTAPAAAAPAVAPVVPRPIVPPAAPVNVAPVVVRETVPGQVSVSIDASGTSDPQHTAAVAARMMADQLRRARLAR